MATVTLLTLIKRFTYRGDTLEEFSNTYAFKQPPPGDDASWLVLTNDVVLYESGVLHVDVEYVRATGHDSNDPHAIAVFTHDWDVLGNNPHGTFPGTQGRQMAGDQAMVAWAKTDQKTNKGKPIYLRKYFHHGAVDLADADRLEGGQFNVLKVLMSGNQLNGVHGGLRSPARDLNVVEAGAIEWVTTRTLKKRGKKKAT